MPEAVVSCGLRWGDAPFPDVSACLTCAGIDKKISQEVRDSNILHNSQHHNMAAQGTAVKTTYEVGRTLQPIYSGGSLALSEDGRILAASLGEDVLLTDLTNGQELGRVEGDGEAITALICMTTFSVYVFVADLM
jgi:hypothetical protein